MKCLLRHLILALVGGRSRDKTTQIEARGPTNVVVRAVANDFDFGSSTNSLGEMFDRCGSLDVLRWFQSNSCLVHAHSPAAWISAIMEKSMPNKGRTAGLLNALVGSCCLSGDSTTSRERAEFARGLLDEVDATLFAPDLVTLCLAHQATREIFPELAEIYLTRAESLHPTSGHSHKESCRSQSWRLDLEKNFGVRVLFDCDDFAVIDKPSGMRLCGFQSLEDILVKVGMPLSTLNSDGSQGFAHRLDRGTSGCLVVAKSNQAHAEWISRFFLRQVEKTYLCLVFTGKNNLVSQEGTVDLPVSGRPAKSAYRLLEKYGNEVAKIKVSTRQGRKHQVRIHCSKGLKASILLDPRYGGEYIIGHMGSDQMKASRALGRFCLHADSLKVPKLGLSVSSPTPSWWNGITDDVVRFEKDQRYQKLSRSTQSQS